MMDRLQPIAHPNPLTTVVRDCEVYAIAPENWWPAEVLGQPITPADIAGQPFISIDVKSHLGASVSTWLAGIAPPPNVKVSVRTYTLARSLVEANIGIAVVDSFTAKAGNSGTAIQMRKITLAADSKVYALTNRSRPPPQSADFFLETIRSLPD
jgi:DNA-binding transcriptional LysR family regulator